MKANLSLRKWALILFIILAIVSFYLYGGRELLNFQYLKSHLVTFQETYEARPFKVISLFLGSYIFLTSLSIPGSIVLTILSGAIFGTFKGVLLVSLAGTIGASVAFLYSRFIFQDYFNQKFQRQFKTIDRNLQQNGLLYLFTLRFIPVSPYVIINLVLGLTNLKLWTFAWTTFIGMIPGNWIYVYAGKKIGEINSPEEIMSPAILISLTLLGILPFVTKKIINIRKKKMVHV